jgi:hypothetical protein
MNSRFLRGCEDIAGGIFTARNNFCAQERISIFSNDK